MTLHDRIMNLPCPEKHLCVNERCGGIVRAAKMAKEADELMAEMAEALTALMTDCRDRDNNLNAIGGFMPYYKSGYEALTKYNTYKERNQ